VQPAELSEIAVNREAFQILLELLPPRATPDETWVRKWTKKRKTLKLRAHRVSIGGRRISFCYWWWKLRGRSNSGNWRLFVICKAGSEHEHENIIYILSKSLSFIFPIGFKINALNRNCFILQPTCVFSGLQIHTTATCYISSAYISSDSYQALSKLHRLETQACCHRLNQDPSRSCRLRLLHISEFVSEMDWACSSVEG